ncbi:MAG: helix-turn-helix transcriptional regulator [Desulfobulbaceae bacterium]
MEPQNKTMSSPGLSGVIPMVRIDGARVRKLRESKGLTQLYLSTVVGVTTDTISRWENRHYQSIKLDNAEKLAGALEVGLEEILEQPQAESEPAPRPAEVATAKEEISPEPEQRNLKLLIAAVAFSAVAVVALLLYALFPRQPQGSLSAERILPPQAPPGQTFPVLIRVRSSGQGPVSLLLKEMLPAGSSSPQSVPAPTSADLKDNSLRWISRTEGGESVYAYLCQVPSGAAHGATLSFSGTVTRKQTLGSQETIAGTTALTVAPFHWADTNRDQMIDDEEILAVYDVYSSIEGLDFDRDRIDSLWAAGGYRWDEEKKKYAVQE